MPWVWAPSLVTDKCSPKKPRNEDAANLLFVADNISGFTAPSVNFTGKRKQGSFECHLTSNVKIYNFNKKPLYREKMWGGDRVRSSKRAGRGVQGVGELISLQPACSDT